MKKNIWICAFATICAGAILTGCGKEKDLPLTAFICDSETFIRS